MKMLIATVILMRAWQLGLNRHVVVVASEQLAMVVIAVASNGVDMNLYKRKNTKT